MARNNTRFRWTSGNHVPVRINRTQHGAGVGGNGYSTTILPPLFPKRRRKPFSPMFARGGRVGRRYQQGGITPGGHTHPYNVGQLSGGIRAISLAHYHGGTGPSNMGQPMGSPTIENSLVQSWNLPYAQGSGFGLSPAGGHRHSGTLSSQNVHRGRSRRPRPLPGIGMTPPNVNNYS